jgi:hypothetical protein
MIIRTDYNLTYFIGEEKAGDLKLLGVKLFK